MERQGELLNRSVLLMYPWRQYTNKLHLSKMQVSFWTFQPKKIFGFVCDNWYLVLVSSFSKLTVGLNFVEVGIFILKCSPCRFDDASTSKFQNECSSYWLGLVYLFVNLSPQSLIVNWMSQRIIYYHYSSQTVYESVWLEKWQYMMLAHGGNHN